jgi:ADP-heptose:LPS heptosyltransferase
MAVVRYQLMEDRDRVLVIFPGALGDLILIGPALRAIRSRHSQSRIELAARPELVRLAAGRLGLDGGTSIDRREIAALFAGTAYPDPRLSEFLAVYNRIYSFFASDNLVFRRMLPLAAPHAHLSFQAFRPPGPGHVALSYLKALDAAPAFMDHRIELEPADRLAGRRHLAKLRIEPGRYVLLFPGSGSAKKNWPIERFIELAGRLPGGLAPLFVTGPAEHSMERIIRASSFAALDGLELAEVAAIAQAAALFVGNDSGVSHLAAAVGARGIVLFGPTDPCKWRPLGDVAILECNPLDLLTTPRVLEMVQWKLG